MAGKRLYVLVRNDLTIAQQAVQAGHAAMSWVDIFGMDKLNGTLIYVTVQDRHMLEFWYGKVTARRYDCISFLEPDMEMEITAVACAADNDDNIFSGLKLMGE